MSEPDKLIAWKKLALEGAVIVISILLAFAIDAWWEDRREEAAQLDQLARVAAEIRTNSARIEEKIEVLDIVIAAASEFLSWMGPTPDETPADRFVERFDQLIRVGTLSLNNSAAQDYLSAGSADSVRHFEVRTDISNWQLRSQEFEKYYQLMRDAHLELIKLTNQIIPSVHFMTASPFMSEHPRSRFSLDQYQVLSSPVAESFIGHYLVRLEITRLEAMALQDGQQLLLDSIDSILAQ